MGTSPSKGEKRDPQKVDRKTPSRAIGSDEDIYKVTVINTGEKVEELDPILVELEALKKPLLPITDATERKRYTVDSFNLLQILATHQQILHHSSKNVSENQEALISKIAPTQMEAHKNMQTVHATGQELAHFEQQIHLIDEVSSAVQSAQDKLIHIISFLDQIESFFPPDFQTPTTPVKAPREEPPS